MPWILHYSLVTEIDPAIHRKATDIMTSSSGLSYVIFKQRMNGHIVM